MINNESVVNPRPQFLQRRQSVQRIFLLEIHLLTFEPKRGARGLQHTKDSAEGAEHFREAV